MDKRIAGLIGAVTAFTVGEAMAAAPNPALVLRAQSFAELLKPIPNASALLRAADASESSSEARDAQLAQYYDRRDGDREDVPPIVRQFMPHHHHHHHHHHDYYDHHHHHHHHYRRYRDDD